MTQDSESVVVPRVPTPEMIWAYEECPYEGAEDKWSAMLAAAPSTSVREEVDEARGIVRDIYWMARRYADGRASYAVGMFNDAVRKAYDAGWLVHRLQDEPPFARDSMFSPEWKALEQRVREAEDEVARLRALVPSTDEGKRHG